MWPKYDNFCFLIRFKSCGAFKPSCLRTLSFVKAINTKNIQSAPDGSRWLRTTLDGSERLSMASDGSRWLRTAPDGSRWLRTAPSGNQEDSQRETTTSPTSGEGGGRPERRSKSCTRSRVLYGLSSSLPPHFPPYLNI